LFSSSSSSYDRYAAFPSSFQLPSYEHDNNPTLVNILAPTPITPIEGAEGGPSSILDYTPTNEQPNSSFLFPSSSSSSVSPTDQAGPFSMDSEPSYSIDNDFDGSDLFRSFLDGSNAGRSQQLASSGLSPFTHNDDSSSFLDLGTLQSTMETDTGCINPYEFDPTFGGGVTSDSEGYISSAASTTSRMRMGPYFSTRKRPSEDALSGGGYPGGLGGSSQPRRPRSLRAGSVGRSSSKQDLPTAFGSLGGQSAGDFPPPSSFSLVPPQAKRRKSFSLASPNFSNSPPSPSSTSNLSAAGGGPLDGPLRRTNSNPHPASFFFAQPTSAHNAFFLPRSQPNSPAQPIPRSLNGSNTPSPASSTSLYSQRPQPFPSFSVPTNFPSCSSTSTFTPSFNQIRSSRLTSSDVPSYCNGNSYPSSAASSSGAPCLGLHPVVETSLEWVPSKPRIRKSIRRRLEKKRDEPQRMVHVLEGRPPPAVEVNLPRSSSKNGKSSSSLKRNGVTAGGETGTEGGTGTQRRKSSSASSTAGASNFGPHPSSSSTTRDRDGSLLPPSSSSKGRKSTTSKGKSKKGARAGTGDSAAGESSGEEGDEEDEEAKMERMMRSFEHMGTELPPRVYEGGVSPLMPEKKKGKIPGSAMDRVSFELRRVSLRLVCSIRFADSFVFVASPYFCATIAPSH